ncbi:MAG TPA: YceI family protein [Steroidobacteraceae bacterium]|nr:YceI family protein [Steroidobacteraceae bacterium]
MTPAFKTLRAGTVCALALLLGGCPAHPSRPGAPAQQAIPAPAQRAPAHLGRPYDVVAGESLLTIQVYRGGPLAKAGHNHVIASHDLAGTIYIPADPMRTTFEIRLPVATLSVDEGALRAQAGQDFQAAVPDSAKEGTRANMLSPALLNAQLFPQIVLRSQSIESGAAHGDLKVHLEAEVREALHAILAPVHYDLQSTQVTISGEMPLRQTDLGLTPFSAMLGALQVEDEMRVKFRIVARPAPPAGGAGH